MQSDKLRLVLVSMVKNESKIIDRMIKSVIKYVPNLDGIFIYDTGSTDNTVELVENLLKECDISGAVYKGSWVNFGISRSESLRTAREWVLGNGWDGPKTWGLFLDADMLLGSPMDRSKFDTLEDSVDGISLNQKNSSIVYANMRLIRFSKDWKCVGPTHEYWDIGSRLTWDQPFIDDIGDGGAKADKFHRDARLLEEELLLNPKHDRTLFYLGQTYQCLGQLDKSNEMLARRVEVGGWDEEVYMASVYMGDNCMTLKQEGLAISHYMNAWQYRQDRTEAPVKIIQYYRKQPKSQFLGWMFLEKLFSQQYGHSIDREGPIGTIRKNTAMLFVNHGNMSTFWEELGILAYYVDKKSVARWRLDEYMLSLEFDWNKRNSILSSYKWYEEKVKCTKFRRLEFPLDSVPWSGESDSGIWRCYNPSIRLRSDDTYDLNLRYANYSTVDAKNFPYRGRHGTIETRNLQCILRGDYTFQEECNELIIPEKYLLRKNNHIVGVEDCRYVQGTDGSIFFATGRQTSTYDSNQIVLISFFDRENITVMPLDAPGGHAQGQCQKNWLPFMHEGAVKFVYQINPFEVWDLGGKLTIRWKSDKISLDGFRGSAGPVPWRSEKESSERFLMVIHNSHYSDGGRRYYHRFLTLDYNLKPVRLSLVCRWTDDSIEYVSGLCPKRCGEDAYIVVFGTKDSEAYLAEMSKESIEKMLWFSV